MFFVHDQNENWFSLTLNLVAIIRSPFVKFTIIVKGNVFLHWNLQTGVLNKIAESAHS